MSICDFRFILTSINHNEVKAVMVLGRYHKKDSDLVTV